MSVKENIEPEREKLMFQVNKKINLRIYRNEDFLG